jgi:SAM-dependent methyltransferase
MRRFQDAMSKARVTPRQLSVLWSRLMFLLHYLVACKGRVLHEATFEDLDEWLAPAHGLYEHDLRLKLFALLSEYDDYALLRSWKPRPSAGLRYFKEALFSGRLQREVSRRTRDFFQAIRQEDIVDHEHKALPFYRAMWEVSPSLGLDPVDTDEEVVKRLHRLGAKPTEPLRVLDIGCGRGRLLLRIARDFPNARLTGTELVEWYHPLLASHGITPVQCHAGRLTLEDNSQDVVVSTDVIEHLRDPSQMVREIHRVLKPGGVFCVGGPAANASFYNRNPLTYLWIALGNTLEICLPPFHNLYAPLTPLKIVHYGFTRRQLWRLFGPHFPDARTETCRFHALKKFRLNGVATYLPVLRGMGDYCLASGRKS